VPLGYFAVKIDQSHQCADNDSYRHWAVGERVFPGRVLRILPRIKRTRFGHRLTTMSVNWMSQGQLKLKPVN